MNYFSHPIIQMVLNIFILSQNYKNNSFEIPISNVKKHVKKQLNLIKLQTVFNNLIPVVDITAFMISILIIAN